ncbi:MAG TPA: hypothetical protein DCE52_12660 [Rhodobacteraceae bacterium]|nr:hypothetical protein [Paracoccaceae bacterium]
MKAICILARLRTPCLLACLSYTSSVFAEDIFQDIGNDNQGNSYSSNITQAYPYEAYWGDTHLHTNLSVDANGMGNIALCPDDAYHFAQGKTVMDHNGMPAKLSRPLDFLVIADHALNMGVMHSARAGDPELLKTETGKHWYQLLQANNKTGSQSFFWESWAPENPRLVRDKHYRGTIWQ